MSGLTQALIISASGIVMLILTTMVLGAVVDYFVFFATTTDIQNPVLRNCMDSILEFARWFYFLTFYSALAFMVYPFVWLVKINLYEDVVPDNTAYAEEYNM